MGEAHVNVGFEEIAGGDWSRPLARHDLVRHALGDVAHITCSYPNPFRPVRQRRYAAWCSWSGRPR
ncbi:MAG: hypothetical protein HZT40_20585 [Candidatus Thiothrix singaporensis]|uniref:Uncharacterized protein n=1 Tax=Candidatus Thiothrix singaporensis TaxID=2799669 RepID=A0A7L6AXA9_9GAMM|nr:MAG: hypothetical protein HZT40_20585 [Candidatus Thiothrix singaporensis]